MSGLERRALALLATVAVTVVGSGSTAQPGAPGPQPAAAPAESKVAQSDPAAPQSRARVAYTRGQSAFAEGKFVEAKAAFEEAYAVLPNPIVLLSVAECEARLGNIEQAHALFERYLSERPDAPDRGQIETRAAQLAATPALLMLTSEPRGASIELDGTPLELHTPAELNVPPGEHQLTLQYPGHEPAREAIQARMGGRHGLRLILRPLASVEATAVEPTPAPRAEGRGPSPAFWVCTALSGAALISGGVFGALALREHSRFNAHPTSHSADRGERLALFADVGFGAGAIAGVTAAVLYFTDHSAPEEQPSGRIGRAFGLAPFADRHTAYVLAHGRF